MDARMPMTTTTIINSMSVIPRIAACTCRGMVRWAIPRRVPASAHRGVRDVSGSCRFRTVMVFLGVCFLIVPLFVHIPECPESGLPRCFAYSQAGIHDLVPTHGHHLRRDSRRGNFIVSVGCR